MNKTSRMGSCTDILVKVICNIGIKDFNQILIFSPDCSKSIKKLPGLSCHNGVLKKEHMEIPGSQLKKKWYFQG